MSLLLARLSSAVSTASPGAGTLTVAGQVALLLKQSSLTTGAGQIAVAGFAPTLLGSALLLPGVSALAIFGKISQALAETRLIPAVGLVSLGGAAPTLVSAPDSIEATITPDPAVLMLMSGIATLESILSQRHSSSATVFRHRSSSYKWWEHEPPPAPPVYAPLPPVQQAYAQAPAVIGLGLAVSGLLALRGRLPEPPRVVEIVPEPRNIRADLESEIQRALKTQRIRRRRREEEFLMLLAA